MLNVADNALGTNIVMRGYSAFPPGVSGSSKFSGGVFDGQYLWLIPTSAEVVVRVDPYDGSMTGYDRWPSGFNSSVQYKFRSGVYDGAGGIWLIPFAADSVIRLDIASGDMRAFSNWPSAAIADTNGKFIGGVWYNGVLYMAPYSASSVVGLDPATGTMTAYHNWPSGFYDSTVKFIGGVLDGADFWMIPSNTNMVVKMNLSTGVMDGYDDFPGNIGAYDTEKFSGGILDGAGGLWLAPNMADQLVRVNTASGSMQGYSGFPSQISSSQRNKFAGGALVGGDIWLAPNSAKALVKINPANGAMTGYDNFPIGISSDLTAKAAGAVFDGASLWLVPYSLDSLLRITSGLDFMLAADAGERVYAPASVTIQAEGSDIASLAYFRLPTWDRISITQYNFDSWFGVAAEGNSGYSFDMTISADTNGIYWVRAMFNDGTSAIRSIRIDTIYTPCFFISGVSDGALLYSEALDTPHGIPLEIDGRIVADPSLGYQEVSISAKAVDGYNISGISQIYVLLNNAQYTDARYNTLQFTYTRKETVPPPVPIVPPPTPPPADPVLPPVSGPVSQVPPESHLPDLPVPFAPGSSAPMGEPPIRELSPRFEAVPPPEEIVIETETQSLAPETDAIDVVTGKRMVTYTLSTIAHEKNMTAYSYRIVARPSAELLFSNGFIPPLTEDREITYTVLYKAVDHGAYQIYASGIPASSPFALYNPDALTLTEIVLLFDEVPYGFARGKEIRFTYEVLEEGFSHSYHTSRNIQEFQVFPNTPVLEGQISELERLLDEINDPDHLNTLNDTLAFALGVLYNPNATESDTAEAISYINEVMIRVDPSRSQNSVNGTNPFKDIPIASFLLMLLSMLFMFLVRLRRRKKDANRAVNADA
ncbi:MAG: hypothetical protein FWH28_08875 [Clostridiales bacterium]|nr:hypothetical protein [Clostridiales bacterium]